MTINSELDKILEREEIKMKRSWIKGSREATYIVHKKAARYILKKLKRFPGNLEELERKEKKKYKIICMGSNNKEQYLIDSSSNTLELPWSTLKKLEEAETLIHYQLSNKKNIFGRKYMMGVPVKIVKK